MMLANKNDDLSFLPIMYLQLVEWSAENSQSLLLQCSEIHPNLHPVLFVWGFIMDVLSKPSPSDSSAGSSNCNLYVCSEGSMAWPPVLFRNHAWDHPQFSPYQSSMGPSAQVTMIKICWDKLRYMILSSKDRSFRVSWQDVEASHSSVSLEI